jgi:hypothetical protein
VRNQPGGQVGGFGLLYLLVLLLWLWCVFSGAVVGWREGGVLGLPVGLGVGWVVGWELRYVVAFVMALVLKLLLRGEL